MSTPGYSKKKVYKKLLSFLKLKFTCTGTMVTLNQTQMYDVP